MSKNETFGTESLGRLLRQQAIPASTGILVMSIYGIVDTIFVGHWVGALGIGAITVVMPITFLISSVGMAIGIGGSSIISRAFGEGNDGKATRTFGNQVILTLSLSVLFMLLGFQFQDEVLHLFGGKGEVLAPAKAYFQILLYGVPFLAWAMMSTNVIRAEGFPKISMIALIVPAITNMILDPIFIVVLDMGIEGAAWATTLAYAASATFTILFFLFGKSQMQLTRRCITPSISIIREIASIGSVTLARQGTISVLSIVLNNALFTYGGELALSVYGIIGRVLMFA
ncbi:MAG: MATE family efflux transporter, partial [Bacteroidota bacterium]